MRYLTIPSDVRSTIRAAAKRERLVLSGRDALSGENTEMSFVVSADRELHLRIGADGYVLSGLERTRILLPGTRPDFSITTIAGSCTGDERGAMVITIDCAREPPALSVAARFLDADPRSWSLQIDHDIQHQLLDFLDA